MALNDEENLNQHAWSVTSHTPHINQEQNGDVSHEPRLLIIEAIQLFVGIFANLFLLLSMARRKQLNIECKLTWTNRYASSLCRIVLSATAARPFKDKGFSNDEIIWSQSFYYGMWAAILYFVDASLLIITFWGACTHHYRKDLLLTTSQRTLMLQSILLLIYLLLGAYIFSEIESWNYLDAVYWTVVTLFTVGFGDYYPATDLGRALLLPFALAGIISLGLVISSVRNLILEHGSRCVGARIDDRKRGKIIRKMLLNGDNKTFDPIHEDFQISLARSTESRQSEFERRKAEFQLMRRIQTKSSTHRRWVAMAISTFLWLLLWLVGACIFQKAEQAYQGWSYFDAFYFCFEAWTTIGYGDLTPVSNAGRSFYVFWSLLALPTMTVLISNASNTVVRIIRDVTILVGSVTILPNDRGFAGNVKSLVDKIALGKVFRDKGTGSLNSAASSKNIDHRSSATTIKFQRRSVPKDSGGLIGASVASQPGSAISGPRNSHLHPLSTSLMHNTLDNLPTGIDFQLLLMSEIRVLINHLKESKAHHYTFEQWAWYLKLIGEDERSPETHCKVNLGKSRQDVNEDVSESGKWSWVGNQSPLLGAQEESEWILDRLMDKLQESLLEVRRWQLGNGSTMSLPEVRYDKDLEREGFISKWR
ncbi:hypothetical protein FOXB_00777 [Fusarium oxysporum f. sp. conglutinans Fo5176]|uniref:Potassium channel domain-containing protein n=1 Tax=Fusarium oxysporum (strain Fo5176) TaxID=660025 RepID=F9F302_FUSOF|nr:hypothetical protein FOXB_00777 [Fusarium oxysporum f. sp. conglutinans Fo5176]